MAVDWNGVIKVVGDVVVSIFNNKDKKKANEKKNTVGQSPTDTSSSAMYLYVNGEMVSGQDYNSTLGVPSGFYVGTDNRIYSTNPKPFSMNGMKAKADRFKNGVDMSMYDIVGKNDAGDDLLILKQQYRVQPMVPQPTGGAYKNPSGLGSTFVDILGGVGSALTNIFGGGSSSDNGGSNPKTGVAKVVNDVFPIVLVGGAVFGGVKAYKYFKNKR